MQFQFQLRPNAPFRHDRELKISGLQIDRGVGLALLSRFKLPFH